MKATIDNLIKALRKCADAHNAEFADWRAEGQVGIKSESMPLRADAGMICDAFFGGHDIEQGWGYTTIYLPCRIPAGRKVDERLLALALPAGTDLNF